MRGGEKDVKGYLPRTLALRAQHASRMAVRARALLQVPQRGQHAQRAPEQDKGQAVQGPDARLQRAVLAGACQVQQLPGEVEHRVDLRQQRGTEEGGVLQVAGEREERQGLGEGGSKQLEGARPAGTHGCTCQSISGNASAHSWVGAVLC